MKKEEDEKDALKEEIKTLKRENQTVARLEAELSDVCEALLQCDYARQQLRVMDYARMTKRLHTIDIDNGFFIAQKYWKKKQR